MDVINIKNIICQRHNFCVPPWIDENGARMHGVCIHTHETSRMGTARVKQEEEADSRRIARE